MGPAKVFYVATWALLGSDLDLQSLEGIGCGGVFFWLTYEPFNVGGPSAFSIAGSWTGY